MKRLTVNTFKAVGMTMLIVATLGVVRRVSEIRDKIRVIENVDVNTVLGRNA